MSPEAPRKPPTFVRQLALAMDLPFVLVGGLAAGGGAGYLLDRWLGTEPFLMIVLGLLGFAGGVWEVLRLLSQRSEEAGRAGR